MSTSYQVLSLRKQFPHHIGSCQYTTGSRGNIHFIFTKRIWWRTHSYRRLVTLPHQRERRHATCQTCNLRCKVSIQGEKHSKVLEKNRWSDWNIDSTPPWARALKWYGLSTQDKLLLLPEHWKNKTFTMRISTIPCSGCPSQAPSAARTLEEEDTHHENKHYSMQWMPFTSSFCCQDTGRTRHSPWE